MKLEQGQMFLTQFESIRKQAQELISEFSRTHSMRLSSGVKLDVVERSLLKVDFGRQISNLEEQSKAIVDYFNNDTAYVRKELNLQLNWINYTDYPSEAELRKVIIGCDKVIGLVKGTQTRLTTEETDTLNHIKKEITKNCESLDMNFEKNLLTSTEEAEKGHFLASAMITSRVVQYILDKFEGKTAEDKIIFLLSKGLIDKSRDDVKQAIIKSSKKARNFFSHRIDTFAEPSDAISLLGDCLKMLDILKKFDESSLR